MRDCNKCSLRDNCKVGEPCPIEDAKMIEEDIKVWSEILHRNKDDKKSV